jgi:hypothetical protein
VSLDSYREIGSTVTGFKHGLPRFDILKISKCCRKQYRTVERRRLITVAQVREELDRIKI